MSKITLTLKMISTMVMAIALFTILNSAAMGLLGFKIDYGLNLTFMIAIAVCYTTALAILLGGWGRHGRGPNQTPQGFRGSR